MYWPVSTGQRAGKLELDFFHYFSYIKHTLIILGRGGKTMARGPNVARGFILSGPRPFLKKAKNKYFVCLKKFKKNYL